jgi:hypothetical protein
MWDSKTINYQEKQILNTKFNEFRTADDFLINTKNIYKGYSQSAISSIDVNHPNIIKAFEIFM